VSYIEREALEQGLRQHFDTIYNEDGKLLYSDHICTAEDCEDLLKFIKQFPTADVVPVVRCKDCKHYSVSHLACRNPHHNGTIGIDGYCSYGERRCEE
jgi:hypothetical protein